MDNGCREPSVRPVELALWSSDVLALSPASCGRSFLVVTTDVPGDMQRGQCRQRKHSCRGHD